MCQLYPACVSACRKHAGFHRQTQAPQTDATPPQSIIAVIPARQTVFELSTFSSKDAARLQHMIPSSDAPAPRLTLLVGHTLNRFLNPLGDHVRHPFPNGILATTTLPHPATGTTSPRSEIFTSPHTTSLHSLWAWFNLRNLLLSEKNCRRPIVMIPCILNVENQNCLGGVYVIFHTLCLRKSNHTYIHRT